MGTITIKVPQNIQIEYEIDAIDVVEGLLEQLKCVRPRRESGKRDVLLGLFADNAS